MISYINLTNRLCLLTKPKGVILRRAKIYTALGAMFVALGGVSFASEQDFPMVDLRLPEINDSDASLQTLEAFSPYRAMASTNNLSVSSLSNAGVVKAYGLYVPTIQRVRPQGFSMDITLIDSERGVGRIPPYVETGGIDYRWIWWDEPRLSTPDGFNVIAGYERMQWKLRGWHTTKSKKVNDLNFTRDAVNIHLSIGFSSAVQNRSVFLVSKDWLSLGFGKTFTNGWPGFHAWVNKQGRTSDEVTKVLVSLKRHEEKAYENAGYLQLQFASAVEANSNNSRLRGQMFYEFWGRTMGVVYARWKIEQLLSKVEATR